ncbi:hypothetical protein [Kingella sp. (in: b-proteobacteria)]|uniref:hypothetical protein n=1 Tax=Kingella sp. (in: b-proteobacteria) TaxID=2020713 RepID=UPI0026DD392F|nr:hypothetical protein [Kingella sp. (in: b-proteobacteria)]
MMSNNTSFSHSKDADLYLKLTADSGYKSEETHRISPDQWARIQEILNEQEQS